jgi:phytoene dehydrogenase-like protein
MRKPVVIVGAGLAGLVCARKLYRAGIPILLLEADDEIGGRLKTDLVDGFRLDRGFQVHLTAYPAAARELDLAALGLESFANGAMVFHEGKLRLIDPKKPIPTLRSGLLPLHELWKLRNLAGEIRGKTPASIKEESAADFFAHHGLGGAAMDRFLRPFFGGVFLDPSLSVSARQLVFVWQMMLEGTAALPQNGIGAIPAQLAADLPRYLIRLRSRVSELLVEKGRAKGVVLDTGERFEAEAVVVATDGFAAQSITGIPTVTGRRSCVTIYYETPRPLPVGHYLTLNAQPGALVNEVAPLSNVQPKLAPKHKFLASATIIGDRSETDDELDRLARVELEAMFPTANVKLWRTLRTYRVSMAQYAQDPGYQAHLPSNETSVPGLYFAGEFTTNSSIDGAIKSGATCGNLLVRRLAAVAA